MGEQKLSISEREIEELIALGHSDQAIEKLEVFLGDCEDVNTIANTSRRLAELFVSIGGPENQRKAFQYALIAIQNFVRSGRAAPAISSMIWLRNFQEAFEIYEKAEKLVIQSFSRRPASRKKSDDHLPVPTPFQEISATVTFEEFGQDAIDRVQLKNLESKAFMLLSNLKAGEVARLLRCAETAKRKDGETIFKEGDRPLGFYILDRGNVELRSPAGLDKVVKEGEFVGDISLFGDMNHSSTATAFGDIELIFFPEVRLRECFETIPRLAQEVLDLFYKRLFMNVAEHSLIFGTLKKKDLERCWDCFLPIHVPAGQVIMDPNQDCDRFFLVLKGKIEVRKYGSPCLYLGPGHFIGERGIILKTMRTATLSTVSDCQLLECDRWSYEELCEDFPEIPRSIEARRKHLETIVFSSKNYVVD